jgi:hypothetical protein
MRGRFLFLMVLLISLWACEDPTTLPVGKAFNGNKLQVAYVDTFSVITSVVQLDSVLTNGTNTILLGQYKDDDLGTVHASSYFQILPKTVFAPNLQDVFDSISLIMPYTRTFVGDTTVPMKINVYQLQEQIKYRLLLYGTEHKLSVFNQGDPPYYTGDGLFNTTKFRHNNTPIVSTTIRFFPRRDSVINIKLPYSFGANWFRLAQKDTAVRPASSSGDPEVGIFRRFGINEGETAPDFIANFFNGIFMDVDAGTNGAIVSLGATSTVSQPGSSSATKVLKIRLYYRTLVNDILQKKHFDFVVYQSSFQFNHIDFDRTGTAFAGLQKLQAMSTAPLGKPSPTGNKFYVQSGTGLVTRLDFPSLKSFFQVNNGIILNAAYLDIQPIIGSYPLNYLPPSPLSLYPTDGSNMPLPSTALVQLQQIQSGTIPISASLVYDHEFGLATVYRYQLFPYIFFQLRSLPSAKDYIIPLILAPTTSQGSSVQRAYFGDRFYPDTKIKLRIYYSYAIN